MKHGLEKLAEIDLFNQWVADEIKMYLGERVLEIGAGIGNVSKHLHNGHKYTASDVDPSYLATLRERGKRWGLHDVRRIDATKQGDFDELKGEFDTVICLNVVEHLEFPLDAVRNMSRALAPGGRLILLVPQHQWLFGSLDIAVGHMQRYSESDLAQLLSMGANHLQCMRLYGFNKMVTIPWYIDSVLLKKTEFGTRRLKVANLLTRVFRPLEKYLPIPAASLIAVAEKS